MKRQGQRRRGRSAFTIVELLVVISIIVMLIALLLPSMRHAREMTRRVMCQSNQRQLMAAMITYADQHPQHAYLPTGNYTIDDITFLFPDFLPDRRAAICPNTQHTAEDLRFSYGSPGPSRYHSYEMFSWIGPAEHVDGFKPPPNPGHTGILITKYNVPGKPSKIWIPMDDSSLHGNNNWPDEGNNHGAAGLTLGFIDGHAGWHSREQYVRAALESYHPWFGGPSTTLQLARSEVPNVMNTGGWHGKWWYQ